VAAVVARVLILRQLFLRQAQHIHMLLERLVLLVLLVRELALVALERLELSTLPLISKE